MTTRVLRAGAAGLLAAGCVAGCQTPPPRAAYSDNPLLVSRQPVVQSAGAQATYRQPVPPGLASAVKPPPPPETPRVALTRITGEIPARAPGEASEGPPLPPAAFESTPPATIAPLPARPLDRPEPPPPNMPQPTVVEAPVPLSPPAQAPGTPAEAPKPAAIAPVSGGATFKESGRYGHASDYTRLRGELDRHYRGHMDLRFRPASEEDSFGGKVRLEGHPQMNEFRAGDVIEVYGELIREPGGESWSQYPRYHVKEIKLIERR